jgi:hypothetical protein
MAGSSPAFPSKAPFIFGFSFQTLNLHKFESRLMKEMQQGNNNVDQFEIVRVNF